ncbi:ArnT family glycosyltransferase [Fluviispira sanaruensis]|uniref:Phospholipid carrier-dependent glycosyltransferase n=1 Tax=Fluviispira sanaruensis TaxID=2493639 RepID=A0A4P2VKH3_FLUSA|nr:glycosyltransferase family 39 protein [Fluviispira sanaruensis]BBH53271.1 phospholipid carrier-dependent glycosyltransferase [Fluviispira sanaruensis]
MSNDEVYYWDWSRNLQLSYLDAPPFVAWISYLGSLLFSGALGARFLLPLIHVFSTLFLVLSGQKYAELTAKKFSNEAALSILILSQLIPAFNLEGILLLPDASLLLGISGALYFLLSAFNSKENKNKNKFPLKYAFLFGLFLGISALSKYHALPIAVGFFLAAAYVKFKINKTFDFSFWSVAILVSIFVASPVFIWNYQNNFASFHFQSQHGFADFSFSYKSFLRYLIGIIIYLLPWFFVLFFAFIIKIRKEHTQTKSIYLISILPFFILIGIISYSALGKDTLPHWTMPGFYLLIPAVALNWQPFTGSNARRWKIYISISLFMSTVLPTALSIKEFNNLLIKSFVYFTGNADPLTQAFLWQDMQAELKNQLNIKLKTQTYSTQTQIDSCANGYKIASLRWYWTAQMAFHFTDQPKIYNFDFTSSSFYTWRDDLAQLAGCKFIVLGSLSHYNEKKIETVMNIEYFESFYLSPYDNTKIVLIKGTMKNKEILQEVYEKSKNEINF